MEAIMKVERIYTRGIVGTARSSTLQEAAATMRKFHVGTLLVMEDGPGPPEVVGILTDRDIVMQAVADGLEPREVRVAEVMTPVVASVAEETELHEAIERMRSAGVRRAMVRNARGDVAGMLSIDDIVDGLAVDLSSLAALLKNEIRRETAEYDADRAAA